MSTQDHPQPIQTPNSSRDDKHVQPLSLESKLELELRIYNVSTLRANPLLAEKIRAFANEGYKYMAEEIKPRWEYFFGDRLPTPESLFDILGQDGMIAVSYCVDNNNDENREGEESGCGGKMVACAATKRWVGDLEGGKSTKRGGVGDGKVEDGELRAKEEEEEDKEGWEILCVTTHVEYMKRGYAGRCIDALINELRVREGSSWTCSVEVCKSEGEGKEDSKKLIIWTQAIEELNGRFWRNRGWREVRRYSKPVGSWGSRFGYDLLVLVREVGL